MQMTCVGAPMIYYGTEAGMWGADDPCDRMPMVWAKLDYDAQTADPLGRPRTADAMAFDKELFNFYQAAIGLRAQSPALRRGDFEFTAKDDAAQFLAFRRATDEQQLFVGFNRGENSYRWEIPLSDKEMAMQIFTASGNADQVSVENGEGKATIVIPALDGVVIRIQSKE